MDTQKMLLTHSINAYEEMLKTARRVDGKLIWTGFTTHLIRDELNLPGPYYTQVMNALKRMGCLEQLQRGGSSTQSKWLMLCKPTEKLFNSAPMRVTHQTSRLYMLEQRVNDVNTRLSNIEALLQQGLEMDFGVDNGGGSEQMSEMLVHGRSGAEDANEPSGN
jgi:hypothetical protein